MIVVVNVINPDVSTTHTEVKQTFVDEAFYCVDEPDGLFKYQLSNIWLVVEKPDEKVDEKKETE